MAFGKNQTQPRKWIFTEEKHPEIFQVSMEFSLCEKALEKRIEEVRREIDVLHKKAKLAETIFWDRVGKAIGDHSIHLQRTKNELNEIIAEEMVKNPKEEMFRAFMESLLDGRISS